MYDLETGMKDEYELIATSDMYVDVETFIAWIKNGSKGLTNAKIELYIEGKNSEDGLHPVLRIHGQKKMNKEEIKTATKYLKTQEELRKKIQYEEYMRLKKIFEGE